jgi:hypothetical protein
MDEIFRKVFPTRRAARFGPRRSLRDDAAWAETLDWQSNEYAFHSLFQAILNRLDSSYRERGLRWDQLSSREELLAAAQRAALWYGQASLQYRRYGIYGYLYRELDQVLDRRARRISGPVRVAAVALDSGV